MWSCQTVQSQCAATTSQSRHIHISRVLYTQNHRHGMQAETSFSKTRLSIMVPVRGTHPQFGISGITPFKPFVKGFIFPCCVCCIFRRSCLQDIWVWQGAAHVFSHSWGQPAGFDHCVHRSFGRPTWASHFVCSQLTARCWARLMPENERKAKMDLVAIARASVFNLWDSAGVQPP